MEDKEIIFDEKNRERIEKAIADAEGRATARCVTYEQMAADIAYLDKKYGCFPKCRREGLRISVDRNCQDFPKAYKYSERAESTKYRLHYRAGKWRVYGISRSKCRGGGEHYVVLDFPEELKREILEKWTIFVW